MRKRKFESVSDHVMRTDVEQLIIFCGESVKGGFTLQSNGKLWLETWADVEVLLKSYHAHDVSLLSHASSVILSLDYYRPLKWTIEDLIDEAQRDGVRFDSVTYVRNPPRSGIIKVKDNIATLEFDVQGTQINIEGARFDINSITVAFDLDDLGFSDNEEFIALIED